MKLVFSLLFLLIGCLVFSQEQVTFYFDSDKYELNEIELVNLNKWITENTNSKILSITGSTDEIGTSNYNDTLSLNRVSYIYNHLKGKVKVRSDFKSISLGEKGAKSLNNIENRKVEVLYLNEIDKQFEEYVVNDYIVKEKLGKLEKIEKIKIFYSKEDDLIKILDKVSVGSQLVLNNIEFYMDSDVLLPASKVELNQWFLAFQELSNINFVIQGHVCCVAKNDLYLNSLSSRRAKSVVDYLESKGVSRQRMEYIGYGSGRPIFPIPEKNGFEALKNRRVEIQIIEN